MQKPRCQERLKPIPCRDEVQNMSHGNEDLRGEHENRKTKRGIRKGHLRVHQVRSSRNKGNSGFSPANAPKRMGKHVKRTRRKVYRGA